MTEGSLRKWSQRRHLTPSSCLCWWILRQYWGFCNEPSANVSHVGPKLSLSAQVQISSELNQAQIRLSYYPKSSCSLKMSKDFSKPANRPAWLKVYQWEVSAKVECRRRCPRKWSEVGSPMTRDRHLPGKGWKAQSERQRKSSPFGWTPKYSDWALK